MAPFDGVVMRSALTFAAAIQIRPYNNPGDSLFASDSVGR